MTITPGYTDNKVLEQPAHGTYNDQWEIPVNRDWGFIDAAFGTTIVFNATAGSKTLTQPPLSNELDPYSYIPSFITIIGEISSDVTYTIPTGVGGTWVVRNLTTNATGHTTTVSFVYAGGGDTIVVERGVTEVICCDTTAYSSPYASYKGLYKPSNTPADDSVTTASIQDGAVTYQKLNSSVLGTVAEYRAGNIGSATFTGVVASSTSMTVTGVTGTIIPGMVLSGGSPAVTDGTTIVSQTSIASGATAGGAGTYLLSVSQTASGSITATMPDTVVTTKNAWDSAGYVTLTPGTTITPDFSFGYNFQLTLNSVSTLANPTNVKVGQSGLIVVTEGSTQTTSTFTGYIGASFSGTISGTTLTATGTVGTIVLGSPVSGSGVTATTTIVEYGSGSGGDGTYILNTSSSVSTPTAMTTPNTTLVVTSAPSSTIYPGMTITSGAGAGTVILSQQTGSAGGIGSYTISLQQNVASTSMTGSIGPFFASYGSYYKFAGGIKPTFSKANNDVNIMAYSVIPGPYILLTTYAGVATGV